MSNSLPNVSGAGFHFATPCRKLYIYTDPSLTELMISFLLAFKMMPKKQDHQKTQELEYFDHLG